MLLTNMTPSNILYCITLHISIVILSTAVVYLPLELFRHWTMEKSVLFITIPSSPDHFDQRRSLRETWLQILPDSYKYKFIVGSNMCNIHPEYRKSEYTCESLDISLPKDVGGNTLLHVNSLESEGKAIQTGLGFVFTVHHPVVIKSLGIQRPVLSPGTEQIARVVLHVMPHNFNINLTDSATKIASLTFHSDSTHVNDDDNGYIYKKLSNPVQLSKGFEGFVLVEHITGFTQGDYCKGLTYWEHGNLLTILNVITTKSVEVSVENYCVLPSFSFLITDISELKRIDKTDEKRAEWNEFTQNVYTQLQVESDEYNDILFLNMIDVYRNLPQKNILFFKWLFENYDVNYVLKTDDDVFVDILKVQQELEKPSKWDWWSCFRISWPVKREGKWRETFSYKEEIYPPFPTGAGYVLSQRALHWLKNRLDTLSVEFQGEDVAMGEWLRGLDPSHHAGERCCWACVDQCHPHSCNTMQLSVSDMYVVWRKYQQCGEMCDCPPGDTVQKTQLE